MNLIYQYWDGPMTSGCRAGVKNMQEYAERIGVKYLFEHNPRWIKNNAFGKYTPHYGQFKIVFDNQFEKYDNILFVDTDVFAVDGLDENIFDNFKGDIGICTEPKQPQRRVENKGSHISSDWDEVWAKMVKDKWGKDMPRNDEGLLKVYNSGMVLYSKVGREVMRQKFVPFAEYINLVRSKGLGPFYTCDQPYLHAMMFVANLDYVEMDNEWNQILHYIGKGDNRPVNDDRTKDTKFVHIQLSGADHMDEATLYRITNLPQSEWKL